MPAFNFRHIKDLAPVFWAKPHEMVKAVEEASREETSSGHESHKHSRGAIEVNGWASRATLDIIGVAGLGQQFDALSDQPSPLVGNYHSIYKHTDNPSWVLRVIAMYVPFWVLGNIPSAANKNVVAGSKAIKQACRDMILDKKRSMCEKGDSNQIDIVSAALRSGAFDEEELVNHVMTFLLAGHETSAAAMTWAIWLLYLYPDVQAKLRAEIRATLPPPDMTGVDTSTCHYLRAVCAEVLRLWGIVPDNEYTIGLECAGIVTRLGPGAGKFKIGDRVCMLWRGMYANRIQVHQDRCHAIPNWMSFEQGPTLPSVYLCSIFALYHLAGLQEGQSVLIHSATGGVGIACLELAKHKKAEVC